MSDTQLTVTLDGGGIEDARAIVRALEGVFGAPGDLPADEGATVRTATFDSPDAPRAASDRAAGGTLSTEVTVTVQGTPKAVEAAARTLSGAFTARDRGAASGDQERERQLLLVP
ncbi:hypothetical protein [Streptomyces sp. NPDC005930]|uniref:hypothetical protein n=1 Tax=Streptomyces sp. NPDC005930 TaxID=3364736 RepID=UPI003677D83E